MDPVSRDQEKTPRIPQQTFILFIDQGKKMNYSFSQGKVTSTYNAKNGIVVIGDTIRRRTGLSSDSSHRHISPPPPEIQAVGPVSDTSSPSTEGGTKTSRFEERIGAHWRQELRHRGREAREEI